MSAWIEHAYRNVPRLRNTRLNVSPGASVPESHRPVRDVVVCPTPPRFFHVTRVPRGTSMRRGRNAKSTILTRAAVPVTTSERSGRSPENAGVATPTDRIPASASAAVIFLIPFLPGSMMEDTGGAALRFGRLGETSVPLGDERDRRRTDRA